MNRGFDEWRTALRGPEETFAYRSGKGELCGNTWTEVVLELLAHGAHHRGQIAVLLRQAGIEPPVSTDLIPALRLLRV